MTEENPAAAFVRLLQIMARLRGPDGCPWDAEQTSDSLKPYLLEEAYEVLDALDAGSPEAIRDELGDLLLQVIFHAQIFAERQQFCMADVVNAIADKLERRHPHVFANQHCPPEQLAAQWESIKADERTSSTGRGEGPNPRHLPALMGARKVLTAWARQGWPSPVTSDPFPLLQRLVAANQKAEKPNGLRETLGELLLAVVDLGHRLGLDGEEALRQTLKAHAKKLPSRVKK
jgi:tetrapyrrole methylase family protein / MazG family protein